MADRRPHYQPPASWLVQRSEDYRGRLGGSVDATYGALRGDAICLPAETVHTVMRHLAAAWPGQERDGSRRNVVELDATVPLWIGTGRNLRTRADDSVSVWSPWWD